MMLLTTAVDVSEYQYAGAMDWHALKAAGVELAIVKATQGVHGVDPQFEAHYRNAHDAGLAVACYHFLGPSDAGTSEAEHHLRVIGDRILDPRTFVVCDWENNAVTGEAAAPMTAVRHFLNFVDATIGENRCAWYTYRSLANLHRASLPWPLWLSDPNPDGEKWARHLDAFMLQTGQSTDLAGHTFTLLTDSIINRETFALLTGESTVITKQDAATIVRELAEAFGLPVTLNPDGSPQWPIRISLFEKIGDNGEPIYQTFAYGAAPVFGHEESKRGKLAAERAAVHSARGADNAGTASALAAQVVELLRGQAVGLTPRQLADAITEALKVVAPFLRVGIAS